MHACTYPVDHCGYFWPVRWWVPATAGNTNIRAGTTCTRSRTIFAIGGLVLAILGLAKVGRAGTGSGVRVQNSNEPEVAQRIRDLIAIYAREFGLDKHGHDVVLSIAMTESSLTDPPRRGAAGEIGPMQVTPPVMQDMDEWIDLDDPLENKVRLGVRWFKHLLELAKLEKAGIPYGLNGVYTVEMYRLAIRAYNVGFAGAKRGNGQTYLRRVSNQGVASWA